ncbi:hypothetical protein HMPREF9120_02918 [Neisseria sp. oral taxon 020 str. F0370]|nr:hypothetical protein HMPREF9120_02918 [Neisseria sp. oral taxon 020 str. F0370]
MIARGRLKLKRVEKLHCVTCLFAADVFGFLCRALGRAWRNMAAKPADSGCVAAARTGAYD